MRQFPIVFSFVLILGLLLSCSDQKADNSAASAEGKLPVPLLRRLSYEQYGLDVRDHKVFQASLLRDQYLRDVLLEHGVSPERIEEIVAKSESVFDLRNMQVGRPFTILKNQQGQVEYFVFEQTPTDFVVFDLRDEIVVYVGTKESSFVVRESAGEIETSLDDAVINLGLGNELARRLEHIFSWELDLTQLEKGDYFKVIYEEQFVEDEPVGISNLHAAVLHHEEEDVYAFEFVADSLAEYYNQDGLSIRKRFMPAPVRPARLWSQHVRGSVGQTLRCHISKGTPVFAMADAVLEDVIISSSQSQYLVFDHGDGLHSQYGPVERVVGSLQIGDSLVQGQVIGFSGKGGNRRSARLEVIFSQDGKPLPWQALRRQAADSLSGETLDRFETQAEELKLRLEEVEVPDPLHILAAGPQQEYEAGN